MKPTVSKEAYNFNLKTKLAMVLQVQIAKMCEFYRMFKTIDDKHVDELTKLLKEQTGIRFTTTIHTGKNLIAAIHVTSLEGHSGVKNYRDLITMVTEKGFSSVISIDLEELRVSGKMVDMFNMTLHLSYGLFETFLAHPRQLVGLILHEVGHPFNFFLGLGDYVYVNYMLTDGTKILMGEKRTTQKVMIVDHTFLTKQIKDPKEQHEFMNTRSEDDVKKVVLSTLRAHPRPYLFYGTKNDSKRDEQLADVLPTRLGYGKDLIEALLTIDKTSPKLFQSKLSFWLMELQRLPIFLLGVIPMAAMLFVLGDSYAEKYDKPWNRIDRIRRDLIAQLKVTTLPEIRDSLIKDIDALEEIAKQYTRNEGMIDGLLYFINRDFRRGYQMDSHERTLESLLNNNMFVLSQKLSQLQK